MNAIGYLNSVCGVASFINTNLQTNNEPFDVHLVSKRKFYPKNTLKNTTTTCTCTLKASIIASALLFTAQQRGDVIIMWPDLGLVVAPRRAYISDCWLSGVPIMDHPPSISRVFLTLKL